MKRDEIIAREKEEKGFMWTMLMSDDTKADDRRAIARVYKDLCKAYKQKHGNFERLDPKCIIGALMGIVNASQAETLKKGDTINVDHLESNWWRTREEKEDKIYPEIFKEYKVITGITQAKPEKQYTAEDQEQYRRNLKNYLFLRKQIMTLPLWDTEEKRQEQDYFISSLPKVRLIVGYERDLAIICLPVAKFSYYVNHPEAKITDKDIEEAYERAQHAGKLYRYACERLKNHAPYTNYQHTVTFYKMDRDDWMTSADLTNKVKVLVFDAIDAQKKVTDQFQWAKCYGNEISKAKDFFKHYSYDKSHLYEEKKMKGYVMSKLNEMYEPEDPVDLDVCFAVTRAVTSASVKSEILWWGVPYSKSGNKSFIRIYVNHFGESCGYAEITKDGIVENTIFESESFNRQKEDLDDELNTNLEIINRKRVGC